MSTTPAPITPGLPTEAALEGVPGKTVWNKSAAHAAAERHAAERQARAEVETATRIVRMAEAGETLVTPELLATAIGVLERAK